MDELPSVDVDRDSSPASFARAFVRQLSEEDREYFSDLLDQLEEEFNSISPLQKGQMAVAHMIQDHLMGKAFNAAKEDDVELTTRDEELLDWARKQYNTSVNQLYKENDVGGDRRSVPEILRDWERENEDIVDGRIEYEGEFESPSIDDVEVDDEFGSEPEESEEFGSGGEPAEGDEEPEVEVREFDDESPGSTSAHGGFAF